MGAAELYREVHLVLVCGWHEMETRMCAINVSLEKAGSLPILNDVSLQSKFERLEHEPRCFIDLMMSRHEWWSPRAVLRGLSPISSLVVSSSMQPQPADPALHPPAEQQAGRVGGLWTWSWCCQSSHFANGCLPLREENNHS